MPRYKDEPTAVRVYTVCDESRAPTRYKLIRCRFCRYLIVRNVPALGCGDELMNLFATYGDVEEVKPMDEEDCEEFTDVYWIKFRLANNARFAKRKLDDSAFLGNKLQVSYAPQFESVSDTKEKLEGRRNEVLARLNPGRPQGAKVLSQGGSSNVSPQPLNFNQSWNVQRPEGSSRSSGAPLPRVSSDQDYFPSRSMNETVKSVREKLNKIESSSQQQAGPAPKKSRLDNRRRI
ncbi:RNA-binding protein 48 [Linum perenne]